MNETFKAILHSSVDLITNSSTCIFTNYDNTVSAIQDFLQEFLKSHGIEDSVENHFSVFTVYSLTDFFDVVFEDDDKYNYDYVKATYDQIISGEIKKPDWWISYENKMDNNFEFFGNDIIIIAHNVENKPFVEKLKKIFSKIEVESVYR